MTDKELQQLARQFAEAHPPKGLKDEILAQVGVDLNEVLFTEMLKWLSDRYCLVEKEIIRKEYEEAKSMHDLYTNATCINEMESRAIDHSQGRMYELTTLFGKELFNEEK